MNRIANSTWKLELRQDQVDTLLECLQYLSGEFGGGAVGRIPTLACGIAKPRVDEIVQYLEVTTG